MKNYKLPRVAAIVGYTVLAAVLFAGCADMTLVLCLVLGFSLLVAVVPANNIATNGWVYTKYPNHEL